MPRILVIDDDSLQRITLKVTLNQSGYEVVTAENGLKALRMMEDEGLLPSVVITDIVMPEMDGLEVIRHFRMHHPDIPLVAISGEIPESFLHLAQRLGAQATISKPVPATLLRETVARLLTEAVV